MKWIGCMMIIAATSLGGIKLESSTKERIWILQDLSKMLLYLSGEIRYLKTPIINAMENIAGRMENRMIREFLIGTKEELESYTGEEARVIWNRNIDRAFLKTSLRKEDIEELKKFCGSVGYLDINLQLENIDCYSRMLQEKTEGLMKESREKCKVYRTLGVLSGIFVVIIML